MSANVESMMYVGHRPWHGLGTRVLEVATSEEALQAARLDWSVTTAPLYANHQDGFDLVPGYQAVVRTHDSRTLGVVGERYVPIQNRNAFQFLDEVLKEGGARYHTAGSLDGGRKVWMLAELPGVIRVGRGDVTEKFLLLVNSHDGSSALRVLPTPVRVVCQNTLRLALARGSGQGLSIRHTVSATTKIAEARRALGLAHGFFVEFESAMTVLAATKFSDLQMRDLAVTLFPTVKDEVTARVQRIRDQVVALFTEGQGHQAIEGTAFAALNAVAEFSDHYRPTRSSATSSADEARLSSAWFGSAAALKQRAFDILAARVAA